MGFLFFFLVPCRPYEYLFLKTVIVVFNSQLTLEERTFADEIGMCVCVCVFDWRGLLKANQRDTQ